MSVINKMLRDLDERRAAGALPDLSRQTRTGVMQDAASGGGRRRASVLRWSALLLLLLAAAAAAWYWQDGLDTPQAAPAKAAVAAPVATPQAVAPPEPAVVASTAVQAVQAAAVAQPPPANTPTAPVAPAAPEQAPAGQTINPAAAAVVPPGAATQTAVAPVAKPVPKVAPDAVAAVARPATAPVAVGAASSAPPVAPAAPPPRGAVSGGAAMPRQAMLPVQAASEPATVAPQGPARTRPPLNALQESMAQAQSLWNAGSREAATSLMRDTVATAERVQAGDVELQQLVRELARMELAQGRGAAVLELLTRLEPRLAGQADLWAVRGNAAQRLGRHADAVHAYQQALKLRGNEQRWMLGAAVSLAALGQFDAAALQTEQARALGPVNPEVLNYLRQSGVPLR